MFPSMDGLGTRQGSQLYFWTSYEMIVLYGTSEEAIDQLPSTHGVHKQSPGLTI